MCLKIINIFILTVSLFSFQRSYAQWDFIIDAIIDSAIDSDTKSSQSKSFAKIGDIKFSTSVRDSYANLAKKEGLKTFTLATSLTKFQNDIFKYSISPFPLVEDTKLNLLGSGYWGVYSQQLIEFKKDNLKKILQIYKPKNVQQKYFR